ncbi:MAG: CDP-glycerol glycerophosphotransferase family protein [Mogibacterium sp.]|nr:CDP-glycerol glycerophosphotransferase family protein [Mogibacterium sp.]
MNIIITIGRGLLQLLYGLQKLAPVRKRITFISRQSNHPSVDIELLRDEIRREMPDYEVVVLCKKIESKPAYIWHMLTAQMHCLATSEVVVLDTYCILASLLRHRPQLRILQMWHALGAYKKFSLSILGRAEGRSPAIARAMRMHQGYDRILASSEAAVPGLEEAYGYGPEAFEILPLPRVDLLRDPAWLEQKRAEILAACPQLDPAKRTLLYAPTFRKTELEIAKIAELADAVDADRYNLIISAHPLMKERLRLSDKVIVLDGYTTMEQLAVCDFFISDYSAVIFEAAAAGKPIWFYAYDIDHYVENRGFYLDPLTELPSDPKRTAAEVLAAIEAVGPDGRPAYDWQRLSAFTDKYIAPVEHCTASVTALIRRMAEEGRP